MKAIIRKAVPGDQFQGIIEIYDENGWRISEIKTREILIEVKTPFDHGDTKDIPLDEVLSENYLFSKFKELFKLVLEKKS